MTRSIFARTAVVLQVLGLVAAGALNAQTRGWPSERPPRLLEARKVSFPPYEIRTLANGMQVVAVPHHEQPAVSMRLIVRAGSAHDPANRPGLARLAAALLDQGTATRSAQEIADAIDYIGGALGTGASSDLSFVNMVVMKDDFNTGMDLLADLVRHPAFAQEEIERQREQALSTLKVSQQDPDYVASVVFDRLVYGFHPYGLPNTGTAESLAAVSRQDLQAFHRRYFVPNNVVLGIVGDLTPAEAFAGAERVFADWPRQELPPGRFPEPPQPTRRVVVVDKPDAVQTEIRVGHIALPRKHPDYMALDLATKILGGEGANRLHRVLRSERGLTYGASADMETLKQSGGIVAETDTRPETTGEALRLIVDEITRLQRERVDDRELADAQAYLAGHFPLTIETPDQIAMQVLNAVFYELPLEELQSYRERVQAVTPEDVQRVARLYLKPDRLSVVLVGNVAAFGGQLRGVGFPEYEVVSLDDLDLMSADFKRNVKAGAPHYIPSEASPRTSEPVQVRLRLARGSVGLAPPPAGRDVLKASENLTHVQGFPAFKTSSKASPRTAEPVRVRLRLARDSVGLAPPPAGRDVLKASENLTHVQGFPAFKTSREASPRTSEPVQVRLRLARGSVGFKTSSDSWSRSSDPGAVRVRLAPVRQQVVASSSARPAGTSIDPRARELITRAIEAKGGLPRLRSLKTTTAHAETTFITPAGSIASTSKTVIVYPDRFRVDAKVQDVELTQVYNRGKVWLLDPGGLRDAPPGMTEDAAASVRRDAVLLLLAAYDGAYDLELLPEERQDGRVLRVVAVSGVGLPRVKLYIDERGLLARQAYTASTGVPGAAPGRETAVEEVFSDYRLVDGVRVAFKAELRRGGTTIVERVLSSIRFNDPIEDNLFEKAR